MLIVVNGVKAFGRKLVTRLVRKRLVYHASKVIAGLGVRLLEIVSDRDAMAQGTQSSRGCVQDLMQCSVVQDVAGEWGVGSA